MLYKKSFITLILLVLFLPVVLKSQTPELVNDRQFRPVARAAVDSIYNFQFEGARHLLQPWKRQYPDHPIWTLIEGMTDWWNVLSDLEDRSRDERFFDLMNRADYQSSQLLRENSRHADALIIKAVSNGYIARQYTNRNQWITGMNRARKAYNAYRYLQKLQPELWDLKLADGLKLYYAAHLPEAYPIVKTVSWFLPEGDKEKGLKYMRMAADSAIFAGAEALYFLGNIHYNYEHNFTRAARYFEQLYNTYPRNNYYARLLVQSYYRMDRYEDALMVIDSTLARWNNRALPYQDVLTEELMTWKGRILDEKGKNNEAITAFEIAFKTGEQLPRTEYRSYHAVSGYYLGKLLHNSGQSKRAIYYLEQVQSGKADTGYRRLAGRLLDDIKEGN